MTVATMSASKFGLLVANTARYRSTALHIQIGRTIVAAAQLSVLAFTGWSELTAEVVGRAPSDYCSGVRLVSALCLGSPAPQQWGLIICAAVLMAVILGIYPRVTGVLHVWVAFSMNNSLSLPDGGEAVAADVTILIALLLISDSRAFAWRSSEPSSSPYLRCLSYCAALGICIQLAGIYFESGLSKLAVPEWADGSAMYFITRDPYFGSVGTTGTIVHALTDIPAGTALLSWGTIFVECLIAVSFLLPAPFKRVALVFVVLLHLGIAVVMGLWSFALVMIGVSFIACYELNGTKAGGETTRNVADRIRTIFA